MCVQVSNEMETNFFFDSKRKKVKIVIGKEEKKTFFIKINDDIQYFPFFAMKE